MKILIVDDEQAILKMYEYGLKNEDTQIVTASDGLKALEMIKLEKPNVVLLDIIMPKLNGLDVLKAIKENPETKDIPVFLLTNLPEECSGEKAKTLGAAGYFVKAQNDPQKVVEEVGKILGKISNN